MVVRQHVDALCPSTRMRTPEPDSSVLRLGAPLAAAVGFLASTATTAGMTRAMTASKRSCDGFRSVAWPGGAAGGSPAGRRPSPRRRKRHGGEPAGERAAGYDQRAQESSGHGDRDVKGESQANGSRLPTVSLRSADLRAIGRLPSDGGRRRPDKTQRARGPASAGFAHRRSSVTSTGPSRCRRG